MAKRADEIIEEVLDLIEQRIPYVPYSKELEGGMMISVEITPASPVAKDENTISFGLEVWVEECESYLIGEAEALIHNEWIPALMRRLEGLVKKQFGPIKVEVRELFIEWPDAEDYPEDDAGNESDDEDDEEYSDDYEDED